MKKLTIELPCLHDMATALYDFYGTYPKVGQAIGMEANTFSKFYRNPDRELTYGNGLAIVQGYLDLQLERPLPPIKKREKDTTKT